MALFIKKNGSLQQVAIGHEISKPEQQKNVSLDLASGDQIVTPDNGQVLTQVLIKKPVTLLASNIKKDVNIAGVVGSYEGDVNKNLNKSINDDSDLYDFICEVENIRFMSMYYDKNVQSITFTKSNVTCASNGCFQILNNLKYVYGNNTTLLAFQNLFYNCPSLELVDGVNIKCITADTFNNSTGLKRVNSNTDGIFNMTGTMQCVGLSNLPLMQHLLLPDMGFIQGSYRGHIEYIQNNVNLIDVYIGGDPYNIRSGTFNGCTSLTDITININRVLTLGNASILQNVGHAVTIHVPSNLISSYQSATNWSTLYNNGDITFVAIQ